MAQNSRNRRHNRAHLRAHSYPHRSRFLSAIQLDRQRLKRLGRGARRHEQSLQPWINHQRRFVPPFRNRPSRAAVQYCYWQSWSVPIYFSLLGAFINRSIPRERRTFALSVFCRLLQPSAHFHASYRNCFFAHETKEISGFHVVDSSCCRGTLGTVVFCSLRSWSGYPRVCVCSCRCRVGDSSRVQDDYGGVTRKSFIVRFYWFVKISALQFTSKCFDWQRL